MHFSQSGAESVCVAADAAHLFTVFVDRLARHYQRRTQHGNALCCASSESIYWAVSVSECHEHRASDACVPNPTTLRPDRTARRRSRCAENCAVVLCIALSSTQRGDSCTEHDKFFDADSLLNGRAFRWLPSLLGS
jgi:hypothetical protein